MKGLELSERFFEEYGRPMLREQFPEYENVIAAGLAGEGSDCFGYDDEISRDHDFEAGFCLWIPDALERELEFRLSRAYGKLPEEFMGVRRARQSLWGGNRRGVILTGEFYSRFTGRPGLPESPVEWLNTPEYSLACAVNGRVFYDPAGEFTAVREELQRGYPEDVRIKKIAARAALMAQSGQYNYPRCTKRGEYGAAAMALHEFTENGLSMIFLLNRKYMPYYKWAFRAGKELESLTEQVRKLESLICGTAADPQVTVEEICRDVIGEMRRQGLTDGSWDYLEPHAMEAMERIRDGNLRNMHVMEG